MIKASFWITTLSLLAMACSNENDSIKLRSIYTITDAGLYPEGIDYDSKNNKFIFGSMYKGAVYSMDTNGTVSVFADNEKLVLVTGVYTDEERDRIIVANADLGISVRSAEGGSSAGSISYVAVYSLNGKLMKEIDLKNLQPNVGACANDIAVDANGNIYITNSFSPIIYKIDNNYNASIFTTNELFQPAENAFGLNGIVYHPDGYLLVAKTDVAKIFKVSLADPSNITEVTGMDFQAPDGLEWTRNHELVIVENGLGLGKTHTFSSNNGWTSASKVRETTFGKDQFPTTAALAANGEVYVINSKLGKLLSGDRSQSTFTIEKIN